MSADRIRPRLPCGCGITCRLLNIHLRIPPRDYSAHPHGSLPPLHRLLVPPGLSFRHGAQANPRQLHSDEARCRGLQGPPPPHGHMDRQGAREGAACATGATRQRPVLAKPCGASCAMTPINSPTPADHNPRRRGRPAKPLDLGRVKDLRARGLSIRQIARLTGYCKSAVGVVVRRLTNPSADVSNNS